MATVIEKNDIPAWKREDKNEVSPDEIYVHCYISKKGTVILDGNDQNGKEALINRLLTQSDKKILKVNGEAILNRVLKKTTYSINKSPDIIDESDTDVIVISQMDLFSTRTYARRMAGEVISDIGKNTLVILLTDDINKKYAGMYERITSDKLYVKCETLKKVIAHVL